MRNLLFVFFNVLLIINTSANQQPKIIGVLNDVSIHPSFNEGSSAIKTSIKDSLGNMNLFEYAHCLKELCELIKNQELTFEAWESFIHSLAVEVENEKLDTIPPLHAVDYKGIIPLQAEFFISSLKINTAMRQQYPSIFKSLITITSCLLGTGYTWSEVDKHLTFYSKNSYAGTRNFYFFLQLYGCEIMEIALFKEIDGWASVKQILKIFQIHSTFRVPIKLQFRKYKALKYRFDDCMPEGYEIKARVILNHDRKGKEYFNNNEGTPPHLLKEF